MDTDINTVEASATEDNFFPFITLFHVKFGYYGVIILLYKGLPKNTYEIDVDFERKYIPLNPSAASTLVYIWLNFNIFIDLILNGFIGATSSMSFSCLIGFTFPK